MSIQGEHDIRDRLSGLLDELEPGPAPVASTVYRGRAIRRRRLTGVVACLAVIVAAVALVPALLRAPAHVSPAGHVRYTITVVPPDSASPRGTVAAGVTDGRRWSMVVSGTHRDATIAVDGRLGFAPFEQVPPPSGWPALLQTEPADHPGSFVELFGLVTRQVTAVVLDLPGGTRVSLKPVAWKGNRWVGLILPARLPVVKATAYDGHRELASAVPFQRTTFNTWLRPGQAAQSRVTRVVGSGVAAGVHWKVTAQFGPWGDCYNASPQGGICHSASIPEILNHRVAADITCDLIGASPAGPSLGIAAASTSVRRVVLDFSDGSSASFPAVPVSGGRVFSYVIPSHASITGTSEYGAAGQLLASTSGAGWKC